MNQRTRYPLKWPRKFGFVGWPVNQFPKLNERLAHSTLTSVTQFINTPGLPRYQAPLVPFAANHIWWDSILRLFAISAHAFVADIWTQILTSRLDKKDPDIFLFYDSDIPQPSELTSLFWLLVCEAWPMPSHVEFDSEEQLDVLFPAQPFMIPQSSPRAYANIEPTGYASADETMTGFRRIPLADLLNTLPKAERERMGKYTDQVHHAPRIHRPQSTPNTCYWKHLYDGRAPFWTQHEGWPVFPISDVDQGITRHELQESNSHMQMLKLLRSRVMIALLSGIGIPTHTDNLYADAGMWIRTWSEYGVYVKTAHDYTLYWTEEQDPVRLENPQSTLLTTVPSVAPRIWFGWTHIGPLYTTKDGKPERVETASESWAKAYLKHRPTALRMLFNPDSIPIDQYISAHTASRKRKLELSGRIKTKPSDTALKESLKNFKIEF